MESPLLLVSKAKKISAKMSSKELNTGFLPRVLRFQILDSSL